MHPTPRPTSVCGTTHSPRTGVTSSLKRWLRWRINPSEGPSRLPIVTAAVACLVPVRRATKVYRPETLPNRLGNVPTVGRLPERLCMEVQ